MRGHSVRFRILLFAAWLTLSGAVFPQGVSHSISDLFYISDSYPDITFSLSYDSEVHDWLVTLLIPGAKNEDLRVEQLYWANGSMLPREELENKDKYWPVLYGYPAELEDPATFSEEKKEAIKRYSSAENRKDGAGAPMFLFDAIYDSKTKKSLESHLVRITFLGHAASVHERVKVPLKRVEERIQKLAKSNKEVKAFVDEIRSTDAYFWRIIAGTTRKSFHSLGIAMDILPKSQHGKQIFWSWAKEKYPDTWMLIPLSRRWMPPEGVIRIFEEEGFVWGGKWTIYDNMHFEYHPELIRYNGL